MAVRTAAPPAAPVSNLSPLRPALMSLLILLGAALLWEGAKAFGEAVGYTLTLGNVAVDLTLLNDAQLPHLGDIARAFGEPAQRNGAPLIEMLISSSAFTLWAAVRGFLLGSAVGFLLALIFAHSALLQRGLLPYVVASQAVPILAIAPMVVIWMGRAGNSELAVPIIAAYLTFFPVTIYTLRGLTSVPPTALELMHSYAANRRDILIKLRIPNALPHIFTALKLSATGSVVGAIIGELPSGIQTGLGIAILNFARYYNQSPPRLYATILAAGCVGILFYAVIAGLERVIVRWRRNT